MPQFAVVIVDGTEPPDVCVFNSRSEAIEAAINVVNSEFNINEHEQLFIQNSCSFYDEDEAFSVDVVQLTHPEDFSRIYSMEEQTV